jgi:hypothetical protein
MVRAGEKIIFTSFIAVAMLVALYIAKDWPIRASIIILLLGTIGIILSCVQFVYDLKDARADNAKIVRPIYEVQAIEHQGRWGSLEIWAWLWGLFFAIHLIGFSLALPLFVFLYVKLYGGGWSTALLLTALTSGFLHGLYDYLLSVPWPKPWLSILF